MQPFQFLAIRLQTVMTYRREILACIRDCDSLLYLSVSTRAVIAQFSATVRPAKFKSLLQSPCKMSLEENFVNLDGCNFALYWTYEFEV